MNLIEDSVQIHYGTVPSYKYKYRRKRRQRFGGCAVLATRNSRKIDILPVIWELNLLVPVA
jgi:hypothetical protein